jgi:hypothetical protein
MSQNITPLSTLGDLSDVIHACKWQKKGWWEAFPLCLGVLEWDMDCILDNELSAPTKRMKK